MKEALQTVNISGYASIFNEPDQTGDVVLPGAFQACLKDLQDIPVLWQHHPHTPIGKVVAAKEDKTGLLVTLSLCLNTQLGLEAFRLIESGVLKGLSIGFVAIKATRGSGKIKRVLHNVNVKEISLVTFPAHVKAQINVC